MNFNTYYRHSSSFLLFKAQSFAAVTPSIPGKWRVIEIKAYPSNILREGVNLDAAWYEFQFCLSGTSCKALGLDVNDSADY